MASILAEAAVKTLCQVAAQPALNEVSIVWNFTTEFDLLKNRIGEINCALNEADEGSSSQKESVKKWLIRVRDIAWEAEDIIEECAVNSMYATNNELCHRLILCYSVRQLITHYQMGRRIANIKARMSSVVEEGNQLNIVRAAVPRVEAAESSSSSQGQQIKRSNLPPRDSKPVGIESKIKSMVSLLQNPQIPIIAVVGMGGIGKTYLLQQLYNSIKGRYEKSAWLSVSQFYSVSKLQRGLAFQLDENLGERINKAGIDEEVAAPPIHDFMQGKKCLIVLDDVWRATEEADLLTKLGIPTGDSSQCKILVSTRNKEVCRNLRAHTYEVECLTDEESWRLFCLHAFPGSEGNRAPQHLEKVAYDIMKECGKLPLAIKTTAASLASITKPRDWQSKLSMLKKVGTSNDPVMDILMLSYHSLPAHVKACFAYLSFFPEDEEIECEYLTYLWKGEGFIPAEEDPWNCLDHLANLCLLEVWEKGGQTPVMIKFCKIHDLLLDLAIHISRENKCAFSLEDAFGVDPWCRLFLAKKDVDEHAISRRHPVSPTLVRTLSLSRNTNLQNIPAMMFSGMRALRVLDLSWTNISTLPACIGKMKLLKVLNLRGTRISILPECVRCLASLSYLDVSKTSSTSLSYLDVSKTSSAYDLVAPKWISELRCLKHFESDFDRMPKGISELQSLRTLRVKQNTYLEDFLSLSVEDDGEFRIEDVGKMSELQEIRFILSHESQLKRMEEGILAPLKKMRTLAVRSEIRGMQGKSKSDLPQFPERMSAMTDLEHLRLHCFEVPSWICCLANLTYLYLRHCDCSNYPELQAMPNLVSVRLEMNERCRELPKAFGKSGGFPHLRFFAIIGFTVLEEFPEMEEGAMACLEKLEIFGCEKLNKVGEGLERLKRLKEIKIQGCTGTDELKEGGTYWTKIKDLNLQINIIVRY